MSFDKFKGIEVTQKPGELPDKMIRRFMKKVRNEGIIQELYDRRAYDKPSVKKRKKMMKARFLRKSESEEI